MNIIFVRHAQKESEGEDPCLTKKGIKQAKILAKKLNEFKIDEFYCSNLCRSKQTSEIVSKKIKIKPKVVKELNEFQTKVLLKNKNHWLKSEKKHHTDLISFLKKLDKRKREEKTVLIIAHGITNRIILSYFLKINLKKIAPFRQRETGINIIHWFEKFRNWRLKIWNDNNHVPKKLR